MRVSGRSGVVLAAVLFSVLGGAIAAPSERVWTVVLYEGKATSLEETLSDADELWVQPHDLYRINGFDLRPEGLCRDELCIPWPRDAESEGFRESEGREWVSLTALARRTGQAYVRDAETNTWSFGEMPLLRAPFLRSAIAPNFQLRDRSGRPVRISDFRGKKVLLLTWASWCRCRQDVPVWQSVYEELREQGLEIISVAQDTAGEAVAGPIFDAAGATYTQIVDEMHRISALYGFVNVPSAAWIDEEGRIVRINEGTYARTYPLGDRTGGSDRYVPALRDWVAKGAESEYAWTPEEVAERIRPKSEDETRGEALFALATYFHAHGKVERAGEYWDRAAALFPDSWNMHRQDWAITEPENARRNWMEKRRSSQKPYYADLELD